MRRRLRERKREREARLLDLGALVYELHRQGKRAPELLQDKAAELAVVDQEVRDLELALEDGEVLDLNEREPDPGDSEQTEEADALEPEAEHEPEAGHEHDPDAEHEPGAEHQPHGEGALPEDGFGDDLDGDDDGPHGDGDHHEDDEEPRP
jgi:hypothetical protein